MRRATQPDVLIIGGFGAAAIFLLLLLFKDLSFMTVPVAIGESVAIGIGGIGTGIAQARRPSC